METVDIDMQQYRIVIRADYRVRSPKTAMCVGKLVSSTDRVPLPLPGAYSKTTLGWSTAPAPAIEKVSVSPNFSHELSTPLERRDM